MRYNDIAALEHASRSVMGYDAYEPDGRTERLVRIMTAVVPALGILAACAVVLIAFL